MNRYFKLSRIYAAAIGTTAPAAIIFTSAAASSHQWEVSALGIISSGLAALSFNGCTRNLLRGYSQEKMGYDPFSKSKEDQKTKEKELAKNVKTAGISSGLMEASLHGLMYSSALYNLTSDPFYIAPQLLLASSFIICSMKMTSRIRKIKDTFTEATHPHKNRLKRLFTKTSTIAGISALSSMTAIVQTMAAIFSENFQLLLLASIPSAIAAGTVAVLGGRILNDIKNSGFKNEGYTAQKFDPPSLPQFTNPIPINPNTGLAELSIHLSMLFAGAAILTDHNSLWVAAGLSLASCSYNVQKYFGEIATSIQHAPSYAQSETPSLEHLRL